jgi:hypothetical protein
MGSALAGVRALRSAVARLFPVAQPLPTPPTSHACCSNAAPPAAGPYHATQPPPLLAPSCRLRVGGRGPWMEVYCIITSHQLYVYLTEASLAEPGPDTVPNWKLELVGAHLASQKVQDVALSTPNGGHYTLQTQSEGERNEWMVGLGKVPGVFR